MADPRTPLEMLLEHPFFQGMADDHLAVIVRHAMPVHFDAGTLISREGDPADRCFVIDHGDVSLELQVHGRNARTIQTIHGGEILGWSWLYPPFRWEFDAHAITHVGAIALDGVALRAEQEEDHEFGYEMMHRFGAVLVSRLQAARLQLMDVYGTTP